MPSARYVAVPRYRSGLNQLREMREISYLAAVKYQSHRLMTPKTQPKVQQSCVNSGFTGANHTWRDAIARDIIAI